MTGIKGILLAAAITLPLASGFGFLIGMLLNKMKGQETIGSLILGYFANGAYQLLFLFIFGGIIPLSDKVTIVGATGVQNTLNLTGSVGLSTAVDSILRIPFLYAVYGLCGVLFAAALVFFLLKKLTLKRFLILAIGAGLVAGIFSIPPVANVLNGTHGREVRVPVVTWLIIGLLCLFNALIMRTRLGQKFRAVGQSQTVANASGINVNAVRIAAIVISTVLAGWGQIIFMQSEGIGTFQTYAAHEQVGLYAGAAILVGGASIDRATNVQALIGTFLFHSLFITAQSASSNLFGNAVVGEYFRAFLSYGVIALALILYAARNARQKKSNLMALAAGSGAVKE